MTVSGNLRAAEEGGAMESGNLAASGTAFALNALDGSSGAALLNDGTYGEASDWIAGTRQSFAGISLGSTPVRISELAFSRNHSGSGADDRSFGNYTVQYTTVSNPVAATAEGDWITLGELYYMAGVPGSVFNYSQLRHRFTFVPVMATGLRIKTLGLSDDPSSWNAIDEIEVYSRNALHLVHEGGGVYSANIAATGTAFAKNVLPFAPHSIANLNDGLQGNAESWIGNSLNSFAGISFTGAVTVDRIAFGRDSTGTYTDRWQGTYTVQYTNATSPDAATPESAWTTLGSFTWNAPFSGAPGFTQPAARHVFWFQPVTATGFRVKTDSTQAGNEICLEELELYQENSPWLSVSVLPDDFSIPRGRVVTPFANVEAGGTSAAREVRLHCSPFGGQVHLANLRFTGADAAAFSIDAAGLSMTMGPELPQNSFHVRFHPVRPGPHTAVLHIPNSSTTHAPEFDVVFTGTGTDTTPPVITPPASVSVNSAVSGGAAAFYSAAIVTDNDTAHTPVVTYSHPSGSTFPVGTTVVTVTSTDFSGNVSTAAFNVVVNPVPLLALEQPAGSALSGTPPEVSWGNVEMAASPAKTFTVRNDGLLPLTLNLSLTGGQATDFTLGAAPASLAAGSTGTFTVTMAPGARGLRSTTLRLITNDPANPQYDVILSSTAVDTTAPVIQPHAPVAANSTDGAGTVVTYDAATVTDNDIAAPVVTYSHPSGSLFPPGTTAVTVTATDAAGNVATAAFSVTVTLHPLLVVEQPLATILSGPLPEVDWGGVELGSSPAKVFTVRNMGAAPLNISALTTTGGQTTDFPVTSALTELPPGGSGTFTVHFSPGNTGARSTTLRLATNDLNAPHDILLRGSGMDTTPPVLTSIPQDLVRIAGSHGGVGVSYTAATATDNAPLPPVISYSKNSGSVFSTGVTTVTVTAADASGNITTASFTVTVNFQLFTGTLARVSEGGSVSPANLAPTGTVLVKDEIGIPPHSPAKLTNGLFGNAESWIAGSGDSFFGVSFGAAPVLLNRLAFGRDNTGAFVDRWQGLYTVEFTQTPHPGAATPATEWVSVGVVEYTAAELPGFAAPWRRHVFAFPEIAVTGIRVKVQSAQPVAVDELELFHEISAAAVTLESPAGTAVGAAGIHFGTVDAYEPHTRTVTVRNDGTADLQFSVTLPQNAGGAFSADMGATVIPLPAGQSTSFTVQWEAGIGSFSGILRVAGTSVAAPNLDIPLTAQGVDTEAPVIAPHPDAYDSIRSGTGKVVYYRAAEVSDNSGAPIVTYSHPSGSVFPPGDTVVTITAADAAGLTATSSFTVHITPEPSLSFTGDGGGSLIGPQSVAAWGISSPAQAAANVPPGLTGVRQFSKSTAQHFICLLEDDSVQAWSDLSGNQVTGINGLTGITSVAAGFYSSLAVRQDTGIAAAAPDNITGGAAGLLGVRAVAAGETFALALSQDGFVSAWGLNNFDVLNVPAGLRDVQQMSCGPYFALVLKRDGTVAAWGDNRAGQCNVPAGLSSVVEVAAGGSFSLALKNDGTVVHWGDNLSWEGSVSTWTDVRSIAAAAQNAFGLRRDGTLLRAGLYTELNTNAPASGVQLLGSSANVAIAAIRPEATFDFGEVIPAVPVSRTFTLGNSFGSLQVHGIEIHGPQAADYTVNTAGMSTSVAAGGSTQFSVTCSAQGGSTRAAVLRLLTNDPLLPVVNVKLTAAVTDTTPPAIIPPANIAALSPDGYGVVVHYPPATATDAVGPVTVTYSHASGSTFYVGTTTVTATATDGAGNVAAASFTITVSAGDLVLNTGRIGENSTPAWPLNLATAPQSTAFAKDEIGISPHAISNLNDSQTGNSASWIAGSSDSFFGISFGSVPQPVNRIAFGRDQTGAYQDRWQGIYTLQYTQEPNPGAATPETAWATLGIIDCSAPGTAGDFFAFPWLRHVYAFRTVQATGMRVRVQSAGDLVAVDEVQLYHEAGAPEATLEHDSSTLPVNGSTLTFSAQNAGTASAEKTFLLTNTGTGTLYLLGLDFISGDAGDFETGVPAAVLPLTGGSSAIFGVRFNPAALGARSAVLRVRTNDEAAPARYITLTGTGVDTLPPVIAPGVITVRAGSPAGVPVFFTPEITDNDPATVPSFTATPPSGTVFAIGTHTVTVTATDASGNTATGTLTIVVTGTPRLELETPAGTPLTPQQAVGGWGLNSHGQLTIPPGLTGVRKLAAGHRHVLALKQDGSVVAWGEQNSNEISGPAALTGVRDISAGEQQSTVVLGDGSVAVFGGSFTPPPGLTGVVKISARGWHTLALKEDGTLTGWGPNFYGELNIPAGLTGVTAVSTGLGFSVAVRSDGTVVAWGRNDYGQCDVPPGLVDVIAISSSSDYTVALRRDGTAVGWGRGYFNADAVVASWTHLVSVSNYDDWVIGARSDGTVVTTGIGTAPVVGSAPVAPYAVSGIFTNTVAAGRDYVVSLREEPRTLDLGTLPAGTTHTVALTLRNTGTGTLAVSGSTFTGDNDDFTVGPADLPSSIASGETGTLTVNFRATALDVREALLRISSSDPLRPEFYLHLRARAEDTLPPLISGLPNYLTLRADGPAGVAFGCSPTVTDDSSAPVTMALSPAPGTLLTPGTHTITVTATDITGKTATANFPVTIVETPQAAPVNRALLAGIHATDEIGIDPHYYYKARDGIYGNNSTWIAGSHESRLTLLFGTTPILLNHIAFGRDNTGTFTDRSGGLITIQYSQEPTTGAPPSPDSWITLGTPLNFDQPAGFLAQPWLRKVFAFPTIRATAIRLSIQTTGATRAIDEFEAYGPAGAFDQWRAWHFGHATAATGRDDDFDSDGVLNFHEFGFGMNPASGSLPSVSYTGAAITPGLPIIANGQALFVRRKDYLTSGLNYSVRFSDDLTTWLPAGTVPAVVADDGTHQVLAIPFPEVTPRRFLRILPQPPE